MKQGITLSLILFFFVLVFFYPSYRIYHFPQNQGEGEVFSRTYLRAVGSATLNNLIVLWSEKNQTQRKEIVHVLMEPKGSSAAASALLSGLADLGPMSREMDQLELEAIFSRVGYKPTAIQVAWDAVEVFVNPENPVEVLSPSQLEAVFSWGLNRQLSHQIIRWSDLNVEEKDLGVQSIRLNGPNSASGTYLFFKNQILKGGDFKISLREHGSGSAVVQGVFDDPAGIGFASSGFVSPMVKKITLISDWCLRALKEMQLGFPSFHLASRFCSFSQPFIQLQRPLYVYILKPPNLDLSRSVRLFVEFVLSPEGQSLVSKDGYRALTWEETRREWQKVVEK